MKLESNDYVVKNELDNVYQRISNLVKVNMPLVIAFLINIQSDMGLVPLKID